MTSIPPSVETVIGADVGKDTVTLCLETTGEIRTVPNTAEDLKAAQNRRHAAAAQGGHVHELAVDLGHQLPQKSPHSGKGLQNQWLARNRPAR